MFMCVKLLKKNLVKIIFYKELYDIINILIRFNYFKLEKYINFLVCNFY